MIWLIGIVSALLIGDAIYSRAKLRLRANATHRVALAHRLMDGGERGGWRSIDEDDFFTHAESDFEHNRIDSILGGNGRPKRGVGR